MQENQILPKRGYGDCKKQQKDRKESNFVSFLTSIVVVNRMGGVHLIADIQEESLVHKALPIKYYKGPEENDCIALWRGHEVEVYKDLGQGTLKLVDIVQLPHEIFPNHMSSTSSIKSALTVCRNELQQKTYLLFLQDSCLHTYVRDWEAYSGFEMKSVKFSFHKQAELCLPLESAIIMSMDQKSNLLVLHAYQGYLHSLSLQKRQLVATYIGTITIVDIVKLEKIDTPFSVYAVLYRDFAFNYSLRYYSLDPTKGTFEMTQQFHEFEVQPTAMTALKGGGVLVFSGVNAFHFGFPQLELFIADENTDYSFTLSGENKTITKSLLDYSRPDPDLAQIVSCCAIDKNRVLAVSNSGIAYMLYINYASVDEGSCKLIIKEFKVVKLNYTTSCKQLIYLGEGEFFAISQLSRSIVFSVLPEEPYVHVLSYFKSSPPVLDLDLQRNQIYSCQGGYNSGEFRNVSRVPSIAKSVKCIGSDENMGSRLLVWNETDDERKYIVGIILDDEDGDEDFTMVEKFSITENASLKRVCNREAIHPAESTGVFAFHKHNNHLFKLSKKGLFKNNESILETKIQDGHFNYDQAVFITITKENEASLVTLNLKTGSLNDISLHSPTTLNPVTSFVDLHLLKVGKDRILILVTFNGCFQLFEHQKEKKLQRLLTKPVDSPICSTMVQDEDLPETVALMLTLANGELLQSKFDTSKREMVEYSDASLSIRPSEKIVYESLPILKSKSNIGFKIIARDSVVIIYDKDNISFLKLNVVSGFFELFCLPLERIMIADVQIIHQKSFVVLYEDGAIEMFRMFDEHTSTVDSRATSFSNLLNYKSIQIRGFSLILCFEYIYSESKGDFEKVGFIKVVHLTTMKAVKELIRYRLPCKDPVDICLHAENKDQFLVLDNNTEKPIHLFKFGPSNNDSVNEKRRISSINIAESQSFDLEGLKFHSIKHIDSERYLISGSGIFVIDMARRSDSEFIWYISSNTVKQKVFTGETAINGKLMGAMDVLSGVEFLHLELSKKSDNDEEDYYDETDDVSNKDTLLLTKPKGEISYDNHFSTAMDICQYELDESFEEVMFIGLHLQNELRRIDMSEHADPEEEYTLCRLGSQINIIKHLKNTKEVTIRRSSDSTWIDYKLYNLCAIGTVGGGIKLVHYLTFNDDIPIKCFFEVLKWSETQTSQTPSNYIEPRLKTVCEHNSFAVKMSLVRSFLMVMKSRQQQNWKSKYPNCYNNVPILERLVYETDNITHQDGICF